MKWRKKVKVFENLSCFPCNASVHSFPTLPKKNRKFLYASCISYIKNGWFYNCAGHHKIAKVPFGLGLSRIPCGYLNSSHFKLFWKHDHGYMYYLLMKTCINVTKIKLLYVCKTVILLKKPHGESLAFIIFQNSEIMLAWYICVTNSDCRIWFASLSINVQFNTVYGNVSPCVRKNFLLWYIIHDSEKHFLSTKNIFAESDVLCKWGHTDRNSLTVVQTFRGEKKWSLHWITFEDLEISKIQFLSEKCILCCALFIIRYLEYVSFSFSFQSGIENPPASLELNTTFCPLKLWSCQRRSIQTDRYFSYWSIIHCKIPEGTYFCYYIVLLAITVRCRNALSFQEGK